MPGDGVIREYSPEMFDACRKLFIEVFNSEPWNDCWTQESAGARLQEFVDNRRFFGFTLWEGETLVGAVFCHGSTYCKGGEVFIDELFVSPACQRKGVGKALMEAVEVYARREGYTIITLLTNREYPSFGFFKGFGCRESEFMVWMFKKII